MKNAQWFEVWRLGYQRPAQGKDWREPEEVCLLLASRDGAEAVAKLGALLDGAAFRLVALEHVCRVAVLPEGAV